MTSGTQARLLPKLAALAIAVGSLSGCGKSSNPPPKWAHESAATVDSCNCARLTAPLAVPDEEDELRRWRRVGAGAAAFLETLYGILNEKECHEIDAAVQSLFREQDALLQEWLDLRQSSCWHFDRWVSRELDSDASGEAAVSKLRSCADISDATRRRISGVLIIKTCR
jgi:hypothetical protein